MPGIEETIKINIDSLGLNTEMKKLLEQLSKAPTYVHNMEKAFKNLNQNVSVKTISNNINNLTKSLEELKRVANGIDLSKMDKGFIKAKSLLMTEKAYSLRHIRETTSPEDFALEQAAKRDILQSNMFLKNYKAQEAILKQQTLEKTVQLQAQTKELDVQLKKHKLSKIEKQKELELIKQQNQELSKKTKFFNFNNFTDLYNKANYIIGAVAFNHFLQSAIRTRLNMDRATNVFSNILPSYGIGDLSVRTQSARTQLSKELLNDFVKFATKYNLNPYESLHPLSQFMATRLEGFNLQQQKNTVQQLFKLASFYNLNNQQSANAFMAFSQIASKGRVSMEEIRRQLGQYIPDITGLSATALGVSPAVFEEMVRSGQLSASTYFEALTEELEKRFKDYKPIWTFQSAINRLSVSIQGIYLTMTTGLTGQAFKGFIESINFLIKAFTKLIPVLTVYFAILSIGKIGSIASMFSKQNMFLRIQTVLVNKLTKAYVGLAAAQQLKNNTSTFSALKDFTGTGMLGKMKGFASSTVLGLEIAAITRLATSSIKYLVEDILGVKNEKVSSWLESAGRGGTIGSLIGSIIGSTIPGIGTVAGTAIGYGVGTVSDMVIKVVTDDDKLKLTTENTNNNNVRIDQDYNGQSISFNLLGVQ